MSRGLLAPGLLALGLLGLGAAPAAAAPGSVIDDSVWIDGAGTKLFLELRGRDSGPIFLYLHGGPGNAFGLIALRAYVGGALEGDALMAYLHQRGVIRSPMVPDSALTIANHVADVAATVRYLANRFPKRPIFLLGHSWGGILAVLVALDHPEHLAGVINVAGPFDVTATLTASYDETMSWARTAGKTDAVDSLKALGPPPYQRMEQQASLSNWASAGRGGIDARLDPAKLLRRPPFTAIDPAWTEAQLRISSVMLGELFRTRTTQRVKNAKVPLLVIVGRRDLVTPARSLRAGYELWGKEREWVELRDSHHLPFVDEPDAFEAAVLGFALRHSN